MRRTPRNQRLLTALVLFGAALGLTGSVAAEPRLGADRGDLRRQLNDLQRRAHELDAKIRRIEAALARDTPVRAVAARPAAPALQSTSTECMLPIYLDSTGIKHVRLECAEAAGQASCDPPYFLDEQGVRRFRPACESDSSAPARSGE